MTSKTSLFDKGIFKNTLKRFKWGGLLYFIILFFSVPFVVMVQEYDHYDNDYFIRNIANKLILRDGYFTIPLLLTIAVPTIVAALAFRFVHSQKQGIATHALPVTRKQNYISTILASFTLMVLPVVLNGIILLLMSFFGYGKLFSPSTVAYWIFVNLTIIFIMFSVAVFSSVLTGNTAAHIVINAFIHAILPLIALTIALICDIFLYGFVRSDSFIAEKLLEYTPIVNIFIKAYDGLSEYTFFKNTEIWIFIIIAIIFYALAYILYKNRKIESCGEVAAFEIFKPILKYGISTAAAIVTFAIMHSIELTLIPTVTIVGTITAIFYFALEMLFQKSFKVFKKYKGYIVLAGALAVVTLFFAYTSIFGYETRIPSKTDIASVTLYEGYNGHEPYISDGGAINDILEAHNAILSDIPITNRDYEEGLRSVYLAYKLQNGKALERRYMVSEADMNKMLSKMYEYEDYKYKLTGIDNINIENVVYLNLVSRTGNFGLSETIYDDASALMAAIKKDISELSYNEIEKYDGKTYYSVEFSHNIVDNEKSKVFKNIEYDNYSNNVNPEHIVEFFQLNINPNFKNAIKLLEEKGYIEKIEKTYAENLWIYKEPVSKNEEEYKIKGDIGVMAEFAISTADCLHIEYDDAKKLLDTYLNAPEKEIPDGELYAVYYLNNEYKTTVSYSAYCFVIPKDELPEYLIKYLD